jgi:hypothetical protein
MSSKNYSEQVLKVQERAVSGQKRVEKAEGGYSPWAK